MSNILVTGGSGFIGSALVKELVSRGHSVFITGRQNEQDIKCPCLSYTFHDLDWKSIPPLDVIFHQAAIANTLHPVAEDFNFVNVVQTRLLFEQAACHGCNRFVYASSCAVYGDVEAPFREDGPKAPLNAYGASKLTLDEWAIPWSLKHGIVAVGLRYSNVYGCGESHKGKSASMIWQLAKQVQTCWRPRLFKWGEQERDFVYIDDVVRCNILAWECQESGVFNVGLGKPTSFNQIVGFINQHLGTNAEIEYIDNPIQSVYQSLTVCDLTRVESALGYKPQVDVEEGVKLYLDSPCFIHRLTE